jgi:thioredoxin 1
MALEVTDGNFEELLKSGKPLVLDFWAEWCGPCRMISPIIDELAAMYDGRVTVGKLDVDKNDVVVTRFSVRNIPTILFFKNGEVTDKVVGAANRSTFIEKIDALLGQ